MVECKDNKQKLGYAYVPVQKIDKVYSPEEGFLKGSLFPELYLPFGVYGGGVLNER